MPKWIFQKISGDQQGDRPDVVLIEVGCKFLFCFDKEKHDQKQFGQENI